jgi:hypothetical protein
MKDESEAIMMIPGGHIRKNDLITHIQATENFDRADRAAAKFDGNAGGDATVVGEFKETDRAVRPGLHRFADMQDIIESFEFDGAFHTEIGSSTARQLTLQCDVNRHGTALDGGIDANDAAGDEAISRIDGGALLQLDILRLGLIDADFSFEPGRIGDTGNIGAGGQLLADLKCSGIPKLLQHPIDAGADLERFDLVAAQLELRAQLLDLGGLHGDLRGGGIAADLKPFLLNVQESGEFLGSAPTLFQGEGRDEAALGELLIHFEIEEGVVVAGLGAGDGGLVIEALSCELHTQIGQFGLGCLQLPFGIKHALFHIGIGQFNQNGVGFNRGAGQDQDTLDPSGVQGRNPENFFWNKRTDTADLAEHVTAFDGIGPNLGLIDRRRGWFESGKGDSNGGECAQTHSDLE